MTDIKFYFQHVDKDGTAGEVVDFESAYTGAHYLYCKGLESVGAPKNIYTESYPEADGLRAFHPTDVEYDGEDSGVVHHSETSIELSVLFEGDATTLRDEYNRFSEFLRSGRIYFWDNIRCKKVLLLLTEELSPEEDTLKGIRYIRVSYKFKNLWGIGKKCNSNGVIL